MLLVTNLVIRVRVLKLQIQNSDPKVNPEIVLGIVMGARS